MPDSKLALIEFNLFWKKHIGYRIFFCYFCSQSNWKEMNLVKSILAIFIFSFLIQVQAFSQEREQYVILISLDGFRHDYVERFKPKILPGLFKMALLLKH
jgi:predicted AlkP superfamily pyrophosphatase or phosphodiesterase